jgi:hypothetical protein
MAELEWSNNEVSAEMHVDNSCIYKKTDLSLLIWMQLLKKKKNLKKVGYPLN